MNHYSEMIAACMAGISITVAFPVLFSKGGKITVKDSWLAIGASARSCE